MLWRGLGFHYEVGTISASFGTYRSLDVCIHSDLCGELPTLYTTGATRIWSSTTGPNLDVFSSTAAWAYAYNGGLDRMMAMGEENIGAHTWGSQRPALYR